MKFLRFISVTIIFWSMLLSITYAHPGRTDENGGHYDKSTGEYHYHHGYPAHQHVDGECPYDFDDKTGENSKGSFNGTVSTSVPPTVQPQIIYRIPEDAYDGYVQYEKIIPFMGVGLALIFILFASWRFKAAELKEELLTNENMHKEKLLLESKLKQSNDSFLSLTKKFNETENIISDLSVQNDILENNRIELESIINDLNSKVTELDSQEIDKAYHRGLQKGYYKGYIDGLNDRKAKYYYESE